MKFSIHSSSTKHKGCEEGDANTSPPSSSLAHEEKKGSNTKKLFGIFGKHNKKGEKGEKQQAVGDYYGRISSSAIESTFESQNDMSDYFKTYKPDQENKNESPLSPETTVDEATTDETEESLETSNHSRSHYKDPGACYSGYALASGEAMSQLRVAAIQLREEEDTSSSSSKEEQQQGGNGKTAAHHHKTVARRNPRGHQRHCPGRSRSGASTTSTDSNTSSKNSKKDTTNNKQDKKKAAVPPERKTRRRANKNQASSSDELSNTSGHNSLCSVGIVPHTREQKSFAQIDLSME